MNIIHGPILSPFVRKVLITLEEKDQPYKLKMVMPFATPPEFTDISPLKKVPVFEDEHITVPDSSIICQYLDAKYPENSIYPTDIAEKAHCQWIEEYTDSKLAECFGQHLFFERFVKKIMGKESDEAKVKDNLENNVPPVQDYLEKLIPDSGFFGGDRLNIADISLGTHFLNARYVRHEVDPARWPKLAAYISQVLDSPAFTRRISDEAKLINP